MLRYQNLLSGLFVLTALALAVLALEGFQQHVSAQESDPAAPSLAATSTDERDEAWNSAAMLRARAWVQDYVDNPDLASKAEAAEHIGALESMTPAQMRLFATLHDQTTKNHPTALVHQAAANHAAQAAAAQKWYQENVLPAENRRAMAANQATQEAYESINRGESEAATQEQSQLNAEQAAARENQQAKMDELNNPYGSWGYGYGPDGLWGYPGYGYGGNHYHFHMYPGPY